MSDSQSLAVMQSPMKIVTVEQMRDLERAAAAHGVSYAQLMDNAGHAVAHWLRMTLPPDCQILVLVGPGNNGGDGLVAARYLRGFGFSVFAYCCARQSGDDSNWPLAHHAGVIMARCEEDQQGIQLRRWVEDCGCIVDAVLGTGTTRPIASPLRDVLDVVRSAVALRRRPFSNQELRWLHPLTGQSEGKPLVIVAVDVPSGLNANTGALDQATLTADFTITFGYPKMGLFRFPGAAKVGKLAVADIGIPDEFAHDIALEVTSPDLVASALPLRPLDAHKGTFGKVLVVAGSTSFTGAASLAAQGAMRVGAGLVTLAIPAVLHPVIGANVSESTYLLLPHEQGNISADAADTLRPHLPLYDVLLLGPGIGRATTTVEFVSRLLAMRSSTTERVPRLVLDADGLYALSVIPKWTKCVDSESILTPHPGEMARLMATDISRVEASRVQVAQQSAKESNATIVLKGAFSVVASPQGTTYINPFAVPTLATAGSGDVLAGVVAGLLAQGAPIRAAAIAGAYLHGLAGQMLCEETGLSGAIASDLLPLIPAAWRRLVSAHPAPTTTRTKAA